MTALAYLIILAFFCTLWHLFWEGLIAPNIRMILRFRLFALRDDLRRLRLEQSDAIGERVFDTLDRGLSAQIKTAGLIHVSHMVRLKSLSEEDPSVRSEVRATSSLLDECSLEKVQLIRQESAKVMLLTMSVNSGGWMFWLLPLFVLAGSWRAWKRLLSKIFFIKHLKPVQQTIAGNSGNFTAQAA